METISLDRIETAPGGLSPLERLGVFFTSQLHDLNNQMSVLSNAELLVPQEAARSPEMVEFFIWLNSAIQRLSGTCQQFNAVRKSCPVEVKKISLAAATTVIRSALGAHPGWEIVDVTTGDGEVFLNSDWLPLILSRMIERLPGSTGRVELSLGELPPRPYQYTLRNSLSEETPRALLVRLLSEENTSTVDSDSPDFAIAMELVRLLGAAISLQRSDSAGDILLAFRVAR